MVRDRQRAHPTHWARRHVPRSLRAPAAAASTAAAAAGLLIALRPRRLQVEGASMLPTFEPGDRVLVARLGRPRPGQVVALADPRRPDRLLVKRLLAAGPTTVEVRGDNPDASTDSRQFGPVRWAAVRGQVVYRYAPAGRVAWWPGRRPARPVPG